MNVTVTLNISPARTVCGRCLWTGELSGVGVATGEEVGWGTGVIKGVWVGVAVGCGVAVGALVGVAAGCVTVGLADGVCVAVGTSVGVAVGACSVCVGEGVSRGGSAVLEVVGDGVGVGRGVALATLGGVAVGCAIVSLEVGVVVAVASGDSVAVGNDPDVGFMVGVGRSPWISPRQAEDSVMMAKAVDATSQSLPVRKCLLRIDLFLLYKAAIWGKTWCPWGDLNARNRLRRPMLYPTELQGHENMILCARRNFN